MFSDQCLNELAQQHFVLFCDSGALNSNWSTVRKALTEVKLHTLIITTISDATLHLPNYKYCVFNMLMVVTVCVCTRLMQQMCCLPWGLYLQDSDHQLSTNCWWMKVIIHSQTHTHLCQSPS